MTYSYFLKLKSYINTYISVTYTEPTVSNHLPQGNHNFGESVGYLKDTVSNVKPKGNHNQRGKMQKASLTVSNHLPQGNHNFGESVGYLKDTVSNVKPKGNQTESKSTPLDSI